jgi:hypothetical protein
MRLRRRRRRSLSVWRRPVTAVDSAPERADDAVEKAPPT